MTPEAVPKPLWHFCHPAKGTAVLTGCGKGPRPPLRAVDGGVCPLGGLRVPAGRRARAQESGEAEGQAAAGGEAERPGGGGEGAGAVPAAAGEQDAHGAGGRDQGVQRGGHGGPRRPPAARAPSASPTPKPCSTRCCPGSSSPSLVPRLVCVSVPDSETNETRCPHR